MVNSHIIPQHHLKQFMNKNGCIFTYPNPDQNRDKQCKSKGGGSVVKNVASQEGYYSEEIEKFLDHQFENKGSKVAHKILNKEVITSDERIFFAEYIASFLYRSPFTREKINSLYPKILQLMQSMDYFMKMKNRPNEAEWFQILTDPDLKNSRIRHIVEYLIKAEHEEIYQVLLSREWWVAEISSSEYFITSDNPLYYPTTTGMADIDIQMTFPLSQKMALVFNRSRNSTKNPSLEYHSVSHYQHNQVVLINQRIADNSNHLYSPKRDIHFQELIGYRVSNNPMEIKKGSRFL